MSFIHGGFVCLWNHRDLEDSLQNEIETILKNNIKDYSYGTCREDQIDIINEIKAAVGSKGQEYIEVPYTTRIWLAETMQ